MFRSDTHPHGQDTGHERPSFLKQPLIGADFVSLGQALGTAAQGIPVIPTGTGESAPGATVPAGAALLSR